MPPLARASPNHPELPVSACRLWQLALMLHAAGVAAFGAPELRRALATEHGVVPNRGVRGDLDRNLLGALPSVNQTNVCPPPFFWLALPAAALACQSASSRRVVSCQKTTRGFGLGRGKRWLQVAQPHHLKSTITLDIRNAETLAALAARRAAVSTP